jgi:polygalacturonase
MKTLLFVVFFATTYLSASSQDYIITAYGVSNDSTQVNTKAIQRVIDEAHENGGGTIIVPPGVFLTGALFFKPNTHLRLQKGAVLKGSDNIADYPLIPSRMEGKNLLYYAALVNAYYVDGFSITGPGKIDGNGLLFWKAFWAHRDSLRKVGKESTNLEVHRPRLVFVWGCDSVNIKDVSLHNAGFWTTHLYQCTNVLVENCDIRSPFRPVPAPSSDGIDIDVCKRVTVRGCYISVNDDGVCIKGGKGPDAQQTTGNGIVEDVLVENCTFGEVHASLTLGSECIHARNITMRNCKVAHNDMLLRFKMRPDTYQLYENITVENITGRCGSIVTLSPWKQFFNMEGSKEKPHGIIRNITISNVDVTCEKFGVMEGNPSDKVENFVFRNIKATAKQNNFSTTYSTVTFDNVLLNGAPLGKK